jgi:hypothetical protein
MVQPDTSSEEKQMSKLTDLSHYQLFVLLFACATAEAVESVEQGERTVNDAGDEIERRFGEGANARLGDWFTATHASPDDMLWHAVNNWQELEKVAREGF